MDKNLIDRINYLARKKKTVGLTQEELKEQEELRNEYRRQFRANLMNQVSNIRVIKSIEENSINEIKSLAIDQIAINENYVSNLEIATILYSILNKEFNLNKDKFFMLDNSAINMMYSLLHLCQFNVNLDDIKYFSKYNYDNEFTILDAINSNNEIDSYTYLLLDAKTLISSQLDLFNRDLTKFIALSSMEKAQEQELVSLFNEQNIEYVIVNNKYDDICDAINKIKEEQIFKFILVRVNNQLISKNILTNEYIETLKKELNVSKIPFSISDITYDDFKKNVISRTIETDVNNNIDSINKILNKMGK